MTFCQSEKNAGKKKSSVKNLFSGAMEFQRSGDLVRTRRRFPRTGNAFETPDHLVDFHSLDQSGNAEQVAGTAADDLHRFDGVAFQLESHLLTAYQRTGLINETFLFAAHSLPPSPFFRHGTIRKYDAESKKIKSRSKKEREKFQKRSRNAVRDKAENRIFAVFPKKIRLFSHSSLAIFNFDVTLKGIVFGD